MRHDHQQTVEHVFKTSEHYRLVQNLTTAGYKRALHEWRTLKIRRDHVTGMCFVTGSAFKRVITLIPCYIRKLRSIVINQGESHSLVHSQ